MSDEVTGILARTADGAAALAKMHEFWAVGYQVSLVAPRRMAIIAVLLTERARRVVLTTGKGSEHQEAIEKARETRAAFIDAARDDLGVDGEPLLGKLATSAAVVKMQKPGS